MNQIHVILTGGTIDSQYDGTKDTVVPRFAADSVFKNTSIGRFEGKDES